MSTRSGDATFFRTRPPSPLTIRLATFGGGANGANERTTVGERMLSILSSLSLSLCSSISDVRLAEVAWLESLADGPEDRQESCRATAGGRGGLPKSSTRIRPTCRTFPTRTQQAQTRQKILTSNQKLRMVAIETPLI